VRGETLHLGLAEALGAQFGLGFFARLAAHQRLALRQAVGVEPLVVIGDRVVADHGHDEVGRDQRCALVQQLVVGVLAVTADTAPDHRAGGAGHRCAVLAHALAVGLHVHLLQVFDEVAQVVVVGQERVALCTPEVVVPDAEHRQQHRHVAFERLAEEMLVHAVGAGQQILEVGHADRQGDGQADRRPQRIATADPVPHRKDVLFADTEFDRRLLVAGDGDEVAVELLFGAALAQIPGACGLGVLQRLEGAERLAGDDEQRGFDIQLGGHFAEFAAVDVRQVVRAYAVLGERQQRLGYQLRAEE